MLRRVWFPFLFLFAMGGSSAESIEAKERAPMVVDDDYDDICFNEHILFNGDRVVEVGNVREALTRIELALAYCSEKVLNLDILLMHVASRLSDYEALDMENSCLSSDAAKKAFEFDILSGILGSEIKELDNYLTYLQMEIICAHQKIEPSELFNGSEIEEKLQDAERSLKQSQEQVAEIKSQSTQFERILPLRRKEIWKGEDDFLENGHLSTNEEWKMQTVEQQRHILQMLERSLARELDLEKELSASRSNAGNKSKLPLLEWENCCIEEPGEAIQQNLFGPDNVAEVLMEVSEGLMSKPQSENLNPIGSVQWENGMRSKLQESMLKLSAEELENFLVQQANGFRDHLKDVENKYITANTETSMLKEKVNSLEEKLRESDIQLQQAKDAIEASEDQQNKLHSKLTEMGNVIGNLQRNIVQAENRAEGAEAKCTLLSKTNLELNEECCFIRSSLKGKENLLESKLKESDARLEHANALAKAIVEEQNLLHAALSDRDTMIKDLKEKVFKAEIRAESAELKCISLAESNLELNEELSFLRGRVECLERSVHQADESRIPKAKDIGIMTKIITHLVMKLVLERMCLQAQITGLERNKASGKCWQRTDNIYATSRHVDSQDNTECSFIQSFKESVLGTSTTHFQVSPMSMSQNDVESLDNDFFCCCRVANSAAAASRTSMDASTNDGKTTKLGSVRSTETRQRSSKHVFYSSLAMVVSMCGMFIFQLK